MSDAKQTCIWGVAQCARFAYSTSSQADMAQLVEHNLAKVGVAGSSPVVRSIVCKEPVDQSALFISAAWPSGKAEACKAFTPGSNPGAASITLRKGRPAGCPFCYSSAFHRPGVFRHLNAFATNYAYPHGTIRSALRPKLSACLPKQAERLLTGRAFAYRQGTRLQAGTCLQARRSLTSGALAYPISLIRRTRVPGASVRRRTSTLSTSIRMRRMPRPRSRLSGGSSLGAISNPQPQSRTSTTTRSA